MEPKNLVLKIYSRNSHGIVTVCALTCGLPRKSRSAPEQTHLNYAQLMHFLPSELASMCRTP